MCFVVVAPMPAMAKGAPVFHNQMSCEIGPVTKTYGGSSWLVYACSDNHSISLVSAPENPANPFLFSIRWRGGEYYFSGFGSGDKTASDASLMEIRALTQSDIEALVAEAKKQP
jgi:hypothetical protein